MVSCVCALEYCHQPEDNEVIKNSNTLVNGEYNGCPCLAWVTEAKSMTRFQLDDGVFCNSTRFAYRRLAPEISGDVVPFDKFRAKVSKLNKRLNLEKNKSFIDKPTLVSLLKEPSALFELTYIIYLLKVNDKPIYAGFTTNLDRRKFEHMYAPANKDIAESIAVFGIDAHEFDIILETKNYEEASKAETNTIDKYKLFTEGCNANRGQASNPLSYFKTLKQINDVYGFFTNFESSDSYPPKKQAAEECQISLQDLTRTFQCLVRWNALLPYRVVGRHISELSEEEVKAVKNAVKQRKAVPGIAKEYNVEHECVKRLRDTVFKDNLSKSGSIMRTNSDDKRFIANCLEYGFSLRKTISIAKSLGIDCPSHKSLSKSLKEYTSIFTKRKSNQILDDINNVLASSDIQPVALNFVIPKKAGRCGYGQQAILTKIVSNFCLSGIPRPFINDGVTFTTEQIRAAIAYVKTGNELALMDGIDSRIDYGQLRTQLLNLKKELGTFGFVLSDDVKSFIKECIKNKISYTQISKKVKERFGVTYCRKVIARNEDSFLLFQAAVKS
jgi:predicted GIY-YIG superfamily endonuclease